MAVRARGETRLPSERSEREQVRPLIVIDSDVLLDVLLGREPHADASSALLLRMEQGVEPVSIAWHTVANVYYVGRGASADALSFIVDLVEWVDIAPTDANSVRYAASLEMTDFEDALQVAAARACDAQVIVTRNLRDYEGSPIRAVSPREALETL
jgi:predicted nucleic acid-binding protein